MSRLMKGITIIVLLIATIVAGVNIYNNYKDKKEFREMVTSAEVQATIEIKEMYKDNAGVIYKYINLNNIDPIATEIRKDGYTNAMYKVRVNNIDKILIIQGIDKERYPITFTIDNTNNNKLDSIKLFL